MTKVGIAELKSGLSGFLDQVKAGREVVITDHGLPIAKLVPLRSGELKARRERLARAGVLRLGQGRARRLLLASPKGSAKEGAAVLSALLSERDEGP